MNIRTVAHWAPLPMGFSRQRYWSGLPRPLPRDLPNSGIEPTSPMAPALAGGFSTTEHHPRTPQVMVVSPQSVFCLLHRLCFSLAPGSLPRVALFFCSLGLRSTSWETSVASVQRAWEDAETLWVSYGLIGKLLTSLGTSAKISWLPGSLV